MRGQGWAWRATFADGTTKGEGDGTRLDDVPRGELARFGLIDKSTLREALSFDCATGVFRFYGHEATFCLGDVPLTGRAGASYRDVVQYKSAHSDWRPGGSTGTVVDAHHIGYRAVLPEALFRVVFRVDARTGGGVRIEAWVTLTKPLPWSGGARFKVLVDGKEDSHGVVFAAPLAQGGAC